MHAYICAHILGSKAHKISKQTTENMSDKTNKKSHKTRLQISFVR